MDKIALQEKNPFAEYSKEIGGVKLVWSKPETIVSVAPFKGQLEAASTALSDQIGLGLLEVGKVLKAKIAWVLWAGHDQWFVVGDVQAKTFTKALGKLAAVTDQTDAWQVFSLTGNHVNEMMSRICSLSLDEFESGKTARTEIAHVHSVVTPIVSGYELMVPRSFAKSVVHKIEDAMEKLDAQKRL